MKRKETLSKAVKAVSTCVIYARFSSAGQKEISIEGQLRVCNQTAEQMGLTVVGTYCDRAVSGTTDDRPEFQHMISDAKKKTFRYILCYSTSRFARNRADASRYKRTLREYGIRVIYAMEKFDETPAGNLSEAIFEALDEFYSQNLSENVKRGYLDSARKHLMLGTRSLGYVRGEDGKHMIEPSEAAIVKRIYNEYESGKLIADIIRDLNKDGIRTTHGRPFTRNSLRTVLRNDLYIGVYRLTDQICDEDVVPPIIAKDQYYKVQTMLEKRQRPRCKREDQMVYFLTGKLFCGHCGAPMTGESGTSKSGKMHYYYSCVEMRKHKCKKKREQKERIEELVSQDVVNTLMDDAFVDRMINLFNEYQESLEDNSELKALQKNLADVQKKKKNLLTAIENGIVTDTTLQRMQELEAQEKECSAAIANYEHRDVKIPEPIVRAFFAKLKSGDMRDSRFRERLVDTFVERIYVYDDHYTIVYRMGGESHDIDLDSVRVSCSTAHANAHRRTRFIGHFAYVSYPK